MFAHASLLETLTVMSARALGRALPFKPVKLDADGIAKNAELAAVLREMLEALGSEARTRALAAQAAAAE
jgi:hypothetical protein